MCWFGPGLTDRLRHAAIAHMTLCVCVCVHTGIVCAERALSSFLFFLQYQIWKTLLPASIPPTHTHAPTHSDIYSMRSRSHLWNGGKRPTAASRQPAFGGLGGCRSVPGFLVKCHAAPAIILARFCTPPSSSSCCSNRLRAHIRY